MSGADSQPTAAADPWRTWANGVTGLRLLAALPCAFAIAIDAPLVAASLYTLAVASDLVDGPVARRRGEASALGGLIDHATDMIFVVLGIAALALRGTAPAPLPPLIFAAFVQYTLDSRAHAGARLRASALGRWNGIAYFVLLGIPVFRDAIGLEWPPRGLVLVLGWTLVVTTVGSMASRWQASRRF